MKLSNHQEVALELLKHKDITVEEAYKLAGEFIAFTGADDYLEVVDGLNATIKIQAGMTDYPSYGATIECKSLGISHGLQRKKCTRREYYEFAKAETERSINFELIKQGKKAGSINFDDANDMRRYM